MSNFNRRPSTLGTAISGLLIAIILIVVIAIALFSAQNDSWLADATATPLFIVANNTPSADTPSTPVPTGESVTIINTATIPATNQSEIENVNPQPSPTVPFTITLSPAEIAQSVSENENCTPPSGWQTYIVQQGDTVTSLALGSGATVAEVIQANCLTMSAIYSGQTVYRPTTPPPRTICGPPATWSRYTVQRGDTIYSLARNRETTVYAVLQANCLVNVAITAGRQLYLPAALTSATPIPSNTPTPQPTNTNPPPPTVVTVIVTATPEPTHTATNVPTSTPTPTAIPSSTPIPVPSRTATATPTATSTAAPTLIVPTGSPQPLNTPTSTSTPTALPTATASPSATATATLIPTDTPTVTIIATLSIPTGTPQPLPTATPTP